MDAPQYKNYVFIRFALEAAHIVSHAGGGNASVENGICLSADLHTLLDSSHLLILNAIILLSDKAKGDLRYAALEVHYATNISRKNPFPGTLTT